MWILIVYILVVVVMELIVVAVGLVLDRIYPSISLTDIAVAFLFGPLVWMDYRSTRDQT